jgi:hypothetical protein
MPLSFWPPNFKSPNTKAHVLSHNGKSIAQRLRASDRHATRPSSNFSSLSKLDSVVGGGGGACLRWWRCEGCDVVARAPPRRWSVVYYRRWRQHPQHRIWWGGGRRQRGGGAAAAMGGRWVGSEAAVASTSAEWKKEMTSQRGRRCHGGEEGAGRR